VTYPIIANKQQIILPEISLGFTFACYKLCTLCRCPPSPVELSYLRWNILLSTSPPKRSTLQTPSINQTLSNTL